jgi:HEAT repeat protein
VVADALAPAGAADPRAQPPLAPDELLARARAEGPPALERLLRALEDRDPRVRQRAHEALVALLEPAQVEGVAERALPRNRLLLWIHRHRHALVLQDGRFVLPPR